MSHKVIALKEHRYGSRRIAAGMPYEIESDSNLRTYKAVGFVKDAPPEPPPKPAIATPTPAVRPRAEKVVAPVAPIAQEATPPIVPAAPIEQGERIGTVTGFTPTQSAEADSASTAGKSATYRRRNLTAEE